MSDVNKDGMEDQKGKEVEHKPPEFSLEKTFEQEDLFDQNIKGKEIELTNIETL